jgi:hypothetical protein
MREEIDRRKIKIEKMKEEGLISGDIKAEPS